MTSLFYLPTLLLLLFYYKTKESTLRNDEESILGAAISKGFSRLKKKRQNDDTDVELTLGK
ncbi:hypothetical protein HZS_1744 [Henneguya salminicola]|nr:hypothetical protein HZS_1744 [Henneguya salminicola]